MRIRHFIRHYLEMLVAMFLGMELLGIPAKMVVDTSGRTTVMLAEMGITMTLPMVAWMAVRGHGWRPNAEMAAGTLVPTAAAIIMLPIIPRVITAPRLTGSLLVIPRNGAALAIPTP